MVRFNNKKILVFVVCIFISLSFVFGAAEETTQPTVVTNTFTLYFDKPPKNTFYFSVPEDRPQNADATWAPAPFNSAEGLQFSLPFMGTDQASKKKAKKQGYPSNASIGITYDLQEAATLEVWFNSSSTHSDQFRLKGAEAGLNFLIGIGNTTTEADTSLKALPNYNKFDGGAPDATATEPVIVIHSKIAAPAGYDSKTNKKDFYEDSGTKILKMLIRSPIDKVKNEHTNYMGGQYKGYIIMLLTTTV